MSSSSGEHLKQLAINQEIEKVKEILDCKGGLVSRWVIKSCWILNFNSTFSIECTIPCCGVLKFSHDDGTLLCEYLHGPTITTKMPHNHSISKSIISRQTSYRHE
mmetsp:Transcript_26039/g.54956  ORF Transcript_26039/g.54956 Transcript_26039/m.54956 type:complete len:105 (-) Transcript_26039:2000-2314(-)